MTAGFPKKISREKPPTGSLAPSRKTVGVSISKSGHRKPVETGPASSLSPPRGEGHGGARVRSELPWVIRKSLFLPPLACVHALWGIRNMVISSGIGKLVLGHFACRFLEPQNFRTSNK